MALVDFQSEVPISEVEVEVNVNDDDNDSKAEDVVTATVGNRS